MKVISDQYQHHLEWEFIDFPIEITNLKFENGLYDLRKDCVIKVWRDVEYNLKATISGIADSPDSIKIKSQEVVGDFIPNEIITGEGVEKLYSYELKGCVIGGFTSSYLSIEKNQIKFEAQLLVDTVHRTFFQKLETAIVFEWFLASKLSANFPRRTTRALEKKYKKIREEIDPETKSNTVKSFGGGNDFILIDTPNIKCIAAKVPQHFGPNWADKICIEYRTEFGELPPTSTREAVHELLSFILGCQLLYIGTTEIAKSNQMASQTIKNPWSNNKIEKCSLPAMPPVKLDDYKDYWRLEYLMTELVPFYMSQREILKFKDALWKFWIAKDSPVGSNLPILSSAVESLAALYLSNHPELKKYYIEPEEYQKLIADEITSLMNNLRDQPFKDIIINKLKGACMRGPNEKIELFFKSIELPISSVEKKAMKARNKMAHSSIDSVNDDEIKIYIKLTHAYETLFHRIFLRLMNYNGNYIDYFSNGHPNRKIEEVIGGSEKQ
jgi:hypothetical protein